MLFFVVLQLLKHQETSWPISLEETRLKLHGPSRVRYQAFISSSTQMMRSSISSDLFPVMSLRHYLVISMLAKDIMFP